MRGRGAATVAASKLGRPRRVEDETVFVAMATVLLRVGWPRLTMNLVADELGITPAALRQRFGAKHEFLVAFYAWGTQQLKASLSEPLDPRRSALDALRAMIRDSVESLSTPAQMLNAMSVFTEVGTEPDLQRMTQERFSLALGRMTMLLEYAIASSEIAGIEAPRLARQLHSCLLGASLVWSVSGRGPIGDELLDAADLVLAPYRRSVHGPGTVALAGDDCFHTTEGD